MAEKPDEEDIQRIRVIYSRLESSWHGLEGMSGNTVEGMLTQYQEVLEELEELTGGDFDGFMPHTWSNEENHLTCHTQDLRAQISSLMGELRPVYFSEQVPFFIKDTQAIALSVNQYVNQEVNVTHSLVVDIALKLEKLESSYVKNTPERKFASKLKDGLKNVKDIASLIGLIVTTAQSVGLQMDKLIEILKALKLV